MSRIGKNPIQLTKEIRVTLKNQDITIEGPKGKLEHSLPSLINIEQNKELLIVKTKNNSKTAKELHGLSRTLINNMVIGVSKGFCKELEIQGVGYRAQIGQKNNLILNVGYSHTVNIEIPKSIKIEVNNNTNLKIQGINKEIVGQLAAQIRSIRPPEPYKGKGIRYQNEIVRKKVGKAGK